MATETVLQTPVLTKFVYPFLLIFFIIFVILEKSKLFGEDKKQINALVAFVIGLIFVSAAYPKLVVGNMILFLTIAIVIVFVVLLLWGFIMGEKGTDVFTSAPKGIKWAIGIALIIAVTLAVIWATGIGFGIFEDFFRNNSTFWTNALFIIVIAAALAVVLVKTKSS